MRHFIHGFTHRYYNFSSFTVVFNAVVVSVALFLLPLFAIGAWGGTGWAVVIPAWLFVALPWFWYWCNYP